MSKPPNPPDPAADPLCPSASDRVFPVRSVVSVHPTPTTTTPDYFGDVRRQSVSSAASSLAPPSDPSATADRQRRATPPRLPAHVFAGIISSRSAEGGEASRPPSLPADRPPSPGSASLRSVQSSQVDAGTAGGHVTARFKHVVTEGGHAIITGRDGEALQRCEDEPIHIPGAIQSFGLLVALSDDAAGSGALSVRIVSENSRELMGRSPRELFALDSFTDILSEEQADNLLDHIDFVRDDETDVATNGPDTFLLSIKVPRDRVRKFWCAMHTSRANPGLIICEFELEDDHVHPLVPPNDVTPSEPTDTLSSQPTAEEFAESTEVKSRPLRVLRSARKRRGEQAALQVFDIMSQLSAQLDTAPNLTEFLKILVGVVKELTGFHRVMIYQFNAAFDGQVVTELVDPRASKDLYLGLHFPASDIPKQARELYKANRVRLLYDRDQTTARLVCRTMDDLSTPLDLTHAYLRAMSPIHITYLANLQVRSSMSISINAFGELWGLISCHTYGQHAMRVSFPIRKMCRLVGDTASRNIERLSYSARLQARKLINTAPTQHNPSGYIIASSNDLLKLFGADFGLLSIKDETKILGELEQSQEALAMLEYLRMRNITSVMTSQDIAQDFPDLHYPPGFRVVTGMLVVPLSVGGNDFIVFFRKGQLREVKWAGNPYDKFVKEGTEGYLEPRKSFKMWRERVLGKCREWTEEEVETAAVLCLVYGKFIEVWRQKEAALQSSQLQRLLLANSAHEVRTPLNAIINYLEIALEGNMDHDLRDSLVRSHSASKSLIYVINDLLDLTKTEQGSPLIKGDVFDLAATLLEATDSYKTNAERKGIALDVVLHPGLPHRVVGDQRRVHQAIANVTANAIQYTAAGGVHVEMYVATEPTADHVDIEVVCTDTGTGMSAKQLDRLFRDLEQVHTEPSMLDDVVASSPQKAVADSPTASTSTSMSAGSAKRSTLGLGLAVVARIIRNMDGQLRFKSEEGKGSRFVIQLPFDLPDAETESGADAPPPKRSPDAGGLGTASQPGTPGPDDELTLIAPNLSRHDSDTTQVVRKHKSVDSLQSSKASIKSHRSASSGRSQMSDVDRLISAIQEPHLVEKRPKSASGRSGRPVLAKRHSHEPFLQQQHQQRQTSPPRVRAHSLDENASAAAAVVPPPPPPPHERTVAAPEGGQESLPFCTTPVKAIKMPDEATAVSKPGDEPGRVLGEVVGPPTEDEAWALTAERLRVLVAEDDPINSKIIKKRLEKLGHMVTLTVNGEDCAGAFCERPDGFDVVLMDMQMPIVDGLTSTKMIRSFEKTHAGRGRGRGLLSRRAARNGRVPIIAVSASLVERQRSMYTAAGFDAWILKPIALDRLHELLEAIVDGDMRAACAYCPGQWERGGWFCAAAPPSPWDADTAPSGKPAAAATAPLAEAPATDDAGARAGAGESTGAEAGEASDAAKAAGEA